MSMYYTDGVVEFPSDFEFGPRTLLNSLSKSLPISTAVALPSRIHRGIQLRYRASSTRLSKYIAEFSRDYGREWPPYGTEVRAERIWPSRLHAFIVELAHDVPRNTELVVESGRFLGVCRCMVTNDMLNSGAILDLANV